MYGIIELPKYFGFYTVYSLLEHPVVGIKIHVIETSSSYFIHLISQLSILIMIEKMNIQNKWIS